MKRSHSRSLLAIRLPLIFAAGVWSILGSTVSAERSSNLSEDETGELARLFEEDQSDRAAVFKSDGKASITWMGAIGLTLRDAGRRFRAKQLYEQNELETGADYYNAAMILQHAHCGRFWAFHRWQRLSRDIQG